MLDACLKLDIYPGAEVGKVINKAIGIADTLKIHVEFEFNGVTVIIPPGTSPQRAYDQYSRNF